MRTDSRMFWYAFVLGAFLAITSCSGTNSPESPVVPQSPGSTQNSISTETGNRYLWTYQEMVIGADNKTIELVPARQTQGHWNVLQWLEQSPCTNCVKIKSVNPTSSGTVEVSIEIRHPFGEPKLTGFDVRGIAMFHGNVTFPKAGLTTSIRGAGQGELVNADGYTSLYNPMTAGSGPGGLQGYFTGKHATPIYPDTTLNGFKRITSPGAGNTRNAFYAGTTITQIFEIAKPPGTFIMGYAVDACWAPPIINPVTNPITDFPPEANCPEPWRLDYAETPVGVGLTKDGGQTKITIDVNDYNGKLDYYAPAAECPQLFDGLVHGVFKQDGVGYTRFEITIENKKLAPNGIYKCLLSVEAVENDNSPSWLNLTAFNLMTLGVGLQLPSNVTGFKVTDGDPALTNRTVKLSWDSISGVNFYDIDRLDYDWSQGWKWTAVKSAAAPTTDWTDGNPRYCGSDDPIQYRIKARNDAGSSPNYTTDTGYPKPRSLYMAMWAAADDSNGSNAATTWARAMTDFNYCNQFWNRFGLNFVLKNADNFFWAGNPAYRDLMGDEAFQMHDAYGKPQHGDSINVYYVNSADGDSGKAFCNSICPGLAHNTTNVFIVVSRDASGTPPKGITITLAHECGHAAARFFDIYLLDSNGDLRLNDGTTCENTNTWCNSGGNSPPLFCDINAAYQQEPNAGAKNPWNLMWYSVPGKTVDKYNLYETQGIWLHEWIHGFKNNYPFPQ